ncbi:MAG: PIN domain-containing protein [Rhizomicrobium sp.]
MSRDLPRIYWDSAAWIAYINREMPAPNNSIKDNRYDMCRATLERANKKEIEIVTSALTLAEVCKRADMNSPANNLPAFFQQPYILVIPIDTQVGRKAQYLQLAGSVKKKPADALHIASALIANVPVFHTFDDYLLSLNGALTLDDGNKLQVVKPTEEIPLPPLLELARKQADEDKTDEGK